MFEFLRRNKKPKTKPRMATRAYRAPRDPNSVGGWSIASSRVERVPAALAEIRARARDLAHNNPYAGRAVGVLTQHAVGRGIRYSVRGDEAYERELTRWARSTACDYDGALNLYGLQAVLVRSMFEAGEGIAVIRDHHDESAGRLYPTIQVVDPDLLDSSAQPRGRGQVVAGVEVDEAGHVVGYHIRPDAESFASEFVRVDDVIHVYERVLPGQLRGIPRGAQALLRAQNVDSFITAALARARVEACLSVFIKTADADVAGALIGEETDTDSYSIRPEILEPGMITPLGPGEDISHVSPASSGGLRDYVQISLQAVAAAYGCTYSQVSGDLSNHNFSSEKAGRLEFNRGIDFLREHFILPALRKLEARYRSDYEASTGADVSAVEITLTSPGREMIEPAKEVNADMVLLASGGMTWSQFCRKQGLDPEEQIAELVREREILSNAGISLKFGLVPIDPDDEDDEDEDGEKTPERRL